MAGKDFFVNNNCIFHGPASLGYEPSVPCFFANTLSVAAAAAMEENQRRWSSQGRLYQFGQGLSNKKWAAHSDEDGGTRCVRPTLFEYNQELLDGGQAADAGAEFAAHQPIAR